MPTNDFSDTKPNRVERDDSGPTRPFIIDSPAQSTQPPQAPSRSRSLLDRSVLAGFPFKVVLPLIAGLLLLMLLGAYFGYQQGSFQRLQMSQAQLDEYLLEQYILAVEDFNDGRFDLARQRYEYIFSQNDQFLDVADRWHQVMLIIGETPQSTVPVLEIEPTPTRDPRPAQELFALAEGHLAAERWHEVIEVLSSLRRENPNYNFVQVDDMFYLALRNRGMAQIQAEGKLEEGLYDFALAEGFGPLDAAAVNLRDLARLYLIGNSFWMAYPDVAAYYYGQVSSVYPSMRDATGMTAFYRYWASLVQWADMLALDGEYCAAADQYQVALTASNNAEVVPTAQYVAELCYFLTVTPTPTGTLTLTVTVTETPTLGFTLTPTPTDGTVTATSTPTPSPTGSSPTPTPTPSPSPTPTATPTPTAIEVTP